ncbi:hypothetical protein [Cohnella fermenti]|uniref:Uncharacterized protein n=1 Tax=Cohnella fermenti TaxID=2565925 RepID=A0A4V3WED6_9BACL|nr:hypothetical protein [Cohnella fermenti]THF75882.1 hypothetical protein E6C55_20475 [Cohnella fermenti]
MWSQFAWLTLAPTAILWWEWPGASERKSRIALLILLVTTWLLSLAVVTFHRLPGPLQWILTMTGTGI